MAQGQQIAAASTADREYASTREPWGEVYAYTDGGLGPGEDPHAGFGAVILLPRVAESLV